MKQIERRVAKLEAKAPADREPIEVTWIIVGEGPEGPVELGQWVPGTEESPGYIEPSN